MLSGQIIQADEFFSLPYLGLLLKERICSHQEQILSLQGTPKFKNKEYNELMNR